MLKQRTIDVPFSVEALKANLERLQTEWDNYQASRDRDGIFQYLATVFELVMWWAHERKAHEYAQRALQLQRPPVPNIADPFAVIIFCTADREKVDYRTRSKWARLLRYARVFKDTDEQLGDFIQGRGGINKCAGDYARILGRSTRKF